MPKHIAMLVAVFISGCSLTNFPALRNCDNSGEARYDNIPLASRSEHEQAQRFTPMDPGNCLVYVVREKDGWSGSRVDRARVILTEIGSSTFGAAKYSIQRNVYAMWELPPRKYLLRATFNYGREVQNEIDCHPGSLTFLAVGDRGYLSDIFLKEISMEKGKKYVTDGLRSVAYDPGSMQR